MPFSFVQYPGNGSTVSFAVPFPYLLRNHVRLYYGLNFISGGYTQLLVDGTDYNWNTGGTQITLTSPPGSGALLTIRRETPTANRLVDFADGSNLIEQNLDTAGLQTYYVVQELYDYIEQLSISPGGNVPDGAVTEPKLASNAVTTLKLIDGVLSANPAGRAKMADLFITTSKLIDGVLSVDPAGLAKMADGYLSADAAGRAKMADLFITTLKLADGALSADADGLAKMADGYLSANAVGRAKMANWFVNTAKLAPNCLSADDEGRMRMGDGFLSANAQGRNKMSDGFVTTEKLAFGITPNVSSLNGGQLAGMRNRIINGAMAIDQANGGASQVITAGAALSYTVDQWYAYCTGANVTGQLVQGANAGLLRYRFTGAAGVTSIGFGQRIEQANTADLAGQVVTLGVDLANSLLATVTWTAFYANTADTFGTLASPTRTQIAAGTFTVDSTVRRYSTQITIPAAATTGIEIVFTVGAQTSGTWTIGNAQLELGSIATPFERRSVGQELALCQRYWETGFGRMAGYNLANSASVNCIYWKQPKRVIPTLTYSAINAVGVATFDIRNASIDSAEWFASTSTNGNFIWVGTWAASARL